MFPSWCYARRRLHHPSLPPFSCTCPASPRTLSSCALCQQNPRRSPALPSSSAPAHELVRRAGTVTHSFRPLSAYEHGLNWVLRSLEAIWASVVKPHLGTADTKPEKFLHCPETPTYHFIFNKRPFLLFHKQNENHREEVPQLPATALQTLLHLRSLSLLLQDKGCSHFPAAVGPGAWLYQRTPVFSFSLCPGSFFTTLTSSYSKTNRNQLHVVSTCLLDSSQALSSPSQAAS